MSEKINPKRIKENLTRRHFIKQSSLAAGVLAIPGLMSPFILNRKSQDTSWGIINKQNISNGWKIKSFAPGITLSENDLSDSRVADEKNGWLPVPVMPAIVHEVLLLHSKIEEPWKPFGMEKCFWVSQKDWVYSTTFTADKPDGEKRLVFSGIRGTAKVYLNGSLIASHSDQTKPLVVDVTGKILSNNSIAVHFVKAAPNVKEGDPDPAKRYALGTYLGPNPQIYTSGLIDDVALEYTDGSLISEIITDFGLNESLTEGKVKLSLSGRSRSGSVKINARVIDPDGAVAVESTIPANVANGNFLVNAELKIAKPQLWWPRGYGDQKLYKVEISLIIKGKTHQKEFRTIGFRRITMPERLHFVVNGIPLFIRGGDWVTPDLIKEVWDQERIETLFAMAENANFNAFRVWGESFAPFDRFYEMADKRGFLLWQDFTKLRLDPDEKSIKTCMEKATQLLIRLKHHPSILCWCAKNEDAMWAHEDYNSDFKDHGPWQGLAAAEAVGQVCNKLDPDRYYQPSTPYYGMNPNDPREGNTHGYTNMWFVPGYDYLNFASEDTRISCPPIRSMEKFMNPEEICPQGYTTISLHGNKYPFPDTWLPYTTGESWKKTGPVEQLYDAADASSLVNRIGMAEGIYYRDLVERQRRGRPATENSDRRCCGGYIVWKYNDSWPEIYSAKVDYFLEPYHAYYALKEVYSPVMLSFDIGTFIYLWAINDSTTPVSGTVKIQLYHLQKCEFRKEIIRQITVDPGKSLVVVQLDKEGIRAFRKEHILFATLTSKDGKVTARTNALADIENRCIFPDARLTVKIENNDLHITTDKFARNINLEGDANGNHIGWFFEDNYFDLFPGETKIVRILGKHEKGKITAKPWYSSNITTVDWQRI
jgi:beta-mannosidase